MKFMVKFYIKNHEFWYKVHWKSQNMQFYENKTSPGDIVGYTQLGTLNKTFKQPWVRYGDAKHADWRGGTHLPAIERGNKGARVYTGWSFIKPDRWVPPSATEAHIHRV